jgi:hypothetical protein
MSFFLHKDCGQVQMVNGEEEEEASPPSYPLGVRRACESEAPPEVVWTSLPGGLSTKCRSPGTGQNARPRRTSRGDDKIK